MGMSFGSRLKHAWNAFTGTDYTTYQDVGPGYSSRPDRIRLTRGNERSIITSVYNRIALDVAALNVQHIRLDENGRFLSVIQDGLNTCLTVEANIDQTARAFIQDIVVSMLDEGCVAIVPVDTTYDPSVTGSYDIQTMRVGKILDWYPQHVRVRLYNERTGTKENILVPKSTVAIVENPLYAVVNEPNSTMQRLIRKLNLLDVIDEQSGSGKLDLIIQLPYVIKTEARRQQAENRRKDIEAQLSGTKYGIAYADGTERITQLNRSVNNNLMSQIEYLTSMFWGSNDKTSGVKVFGMENVWGNLWRRTAGWINANGTQKVKLTRGTHDGSTATDYNTDGNGYKTIANATPAGSSGGYISSMKTEAFGRLPVNASGSSSTYEADGMWYNNSQVNYAFVGGYWSNDLMVGPFCATLDYAASVSASDFGAALSCKPLAAA